MRKVLAVPFFVTVLMTASVCLAHTPLCSCFDNGDGTIMCEGGFSDGSTASGVKMSVKDKSGALITEGKMSEVSEFTFKKPAGEFTVYFDAGEGHLIEIKGSNIK